MQMYNTSRKILDVAFFPKDDYYRSVFTGESIVLKPHPEDPKWMESTCLLTSSCEKDKTFFYGSIQHHQDCYLLPATQCL
jgi:hypothetical protein